MEDTTVSEPAAPVPTDISSERDCAPAGRPASARPPAMTSATAKAIPLMRPATARKRRPADGTAIRPQSLPVGAIHPPPARTSAPSLALASVSRSTLCDATGVVTYGASFQLRTRGFHALRPVAARPGAGLMRILIVEDDRALASGLKRSLASLGYAVDHEGRCGGCGRAGNPRGVQSGRARSRPAERQRI